MGFQIHCPKCTSPECRRSRSGWARHLTRFLLIYPFRCRRCEARFWRFAPFTPAAPGRKRKSQDAAPQGPPELAFPHPAG